MNTFAPPLLGLLLAATALPAPYVWAVDEPTTPDPLDTAGTLMPRADSRLPVVLIGGGADIVSSFIATEKDTVWVREVLAERRFDVSTWYNDGNDTASDVQIHLPPAVAPSPLAALALVFGNEAHDRVQYRNHELGEIAGGTERELLLPSLQAALSGHEQDPLLLVYTGTALLDDEGEAALALWNGSEMRVADFAQLLAERSAATRFLFTQPNASAFHQLAYTPGPGASCGFTTDAIESLDHLHYHLTQGNPLEDGGYFEHFVSALSGSLQNGNIITREPDLDRDGELSWREAHLHAFELGSDNGLPSSSSENYLEQWEPWFLRWLPEPDFVPNNEYARIYRSIADALDIPLDGKAAGAIRERLNLIDQNISQTETQLNAVHETANELQSQLRRAAWRQWPELQAPYTTAYQSLAQAGALPLISAWLEEKSEIDTLRSALQRARALAEEVHTLEHQHTRLRKLAYLRRLAQLKDALYQHGNVEQIATYEALLECESAAVPVKANMQKAGRMYALPDDSLR